MSLLSTLVGMVDRPGAAFGEVTRRPRSWWLPAVILVLSFLLLNWVSAPYQVALANERTAEVIERLSANLSEEQVRLVSESNAVITLQRYMLTTVGLGLVGIALGWFLRGGFVHLSGMALGGKSPWPATYAVGVWSMLPYTVRDLLQTALVLTRQQVIEHQGLAFLAASGNWLTDSRSLLYGLLGQIDPFVIWQLTLLTVGLSVSGRISFRQAFVLSFAVWALFGALKLIPVALGSAFGGMLG
jgi:hypothetical protein